jgi:hypothetical protein
LNTIRNYKTSSFRQIADIDLGVPPWNEGTGWDPIGDYVWSDPSRSFRGNYNGGGYKISNMYINNYDSGFQGLFGSTVGCKFRNINITNFNIETERGYLGGLTGISYNDTWQNINVVGTIKGYSDMGLMSSFFEGYNIDNCHAKGAIISTGGGWIGGLVANCNADSITNSSVEAKVSCNEWINGGFIAQNIDTGLIENCSAIINLTATEGNSIGGFIGSTNTVNRSLIISNCYSMGVLLAGTDSDSEDIGGFIGVAAGYNPYMINIKNCYSKVDVTGVIMIGGFIGRAHQLINFENCYSVGQIIGNTNVGGLIGCIHDPETVTVTNSYWDMETSDIDSSAAGEGRTTAEMTLPYSGNTYVDWDFTSVWRDDVINQNDGYPTFLWVSGIEENEDGYASLQRGFALFQNYPNPFNPVTSIKFALAKTADVKLSVYNIAGQLVSQLASGTRNAGIHTIDFDGSRFNSGVYYYMLEVDGKNITKKMVLTK